MAGFLRSARYARGLFRLWLVLAAIALMAAAFEAASRANRLGDAFGVEKELVEVGEKYAASPEWWSRRQATPRELAIIDGPKAKAARREVLVRLLASNVAVAGSWCLSVLALGFAGRWIARGFAP